VHPIERCSQVPFLKACLNIILPFFIIVCMIICFLCFCLIL
jgi:hypothetical protein